MEQWGRVYHQHLAPASPSQRLRSTRGINLNSACFEGEKLAVTKAVETCGAAEADHFLINLGLLTCSAFFAWRALTRVSVQYFASRSGF